MRDDTGMGVGCHWCSTNEPSLKAHSVLPDYYDIYIAFI